MNILNFYYFGSILKQIAVVRKYVNLKLQDSKMFAKNLICCPKMRFTYLQYVETDHVQNGENEVRFGGRESDDVHRRY